MKTCLVVDDSKMIRRVAGRILKDLKFDTDVAENGQEAITQCKTKMPDAILLDWNMPVMDGHEFLSEIRRDTNLARSVIFILTTSGSEEDRRKAYEKHVSGYLLKDRAGDEFSKKIRMLSLFMDTICFPEEY